MDINDIRGLITAVFMAAFVYMVFQVYRPKAKKQYDDTAMLVFDNEIDQTPSNHTNTERA